MNSKDFLAEVKNSTSCPANFEKIYHEFQGYQKDALDTLKEIHRVCEKYSVPYQVAYGSLLGLIRDGGQIPWDYDIDIIVPYEQKTRLIDVFLKELDQRFYFYCPEVNEKCRHMIMRVAPVEYRTEALHVDVFFYVGTPEDESERKQFAVKIAKLSNARFGKLVNIQEESLGRVKPYLKMLLCRKLPVLFMSLKYINQEYRRLCTSYSSADSTYCISADAFATWKEVPSALLWNTKLVDCDYGTVRIPEHYDELLTLMYGDYKSIPPLENRIKEVVNNHKRINAFNKMHRK